MKTTPLVKLLSALLIALVLAALWGGTFAQTQPTAVKPQPAAVNPQTAVNPPAAEKPPEVQFEYAVFPLGKPTIARMLAAEARRELDAVASPDAKTAKAPIPPLSAGDAGKVQEFLQNEGVDFAGVAGSGLIYDGVALLITQTHENMDKCRAILRPYVQSKRISFEVKSIKVMDDELEGLKTDWAKMVLRCWDTLDTRQAAANGYLLLTPPVINRADAEAVFRALAGLPGSEPVEQPSPSRTVITGAPANFIWAKAIRFTDDGQVDYSGDAVVTTKGSQHVYTRNIGTELKFTPTDVADNRTISVDFRWRMTEFEGFVEYGGQSAAGSGREASPTTPPVGFLQPIFSTRECNSTVMVPNGATLVLAFDIYENGNLPDSKTETSSRMAPRAVLKTRFTEHEDPPRPRGSGVVFITATIVEQPAAK